MLGDDGYYHLNSADGPILLVDMNYMDIVLTNVLKSERPVMNAYVDNADGSKTRYDIGAAVQAYENVTDVDGYYPLTEDLIFFYDVYATASGTWSFHLGSGYNEACVWMYCMRTMTLPEEPVELIKWVGTNVRLGEALALNFALDASQLNGTTGNYIVLTRTYADGTTDTVKVPQSQWVSAGGSYIKVTYYDLAAKEMGDLITAVVYNADDQVISETRTDSIATYSMRMLGKANDAQKTLYVDMLNYGAAAQLYFGYDAENLVNADLTEEQAGFASEAVEIADHRQSSGCYFGSNLKLEREIYLQVAFQAAYAEGMYAVASFTNHYGDVEEQKLTVTENGNFVIVRVEGMAIADYRALVTCKLYSADGTELGCVIDSMESYVARKADSLNRNGADLGDAIMKLGASSYAYFHSEEKD